MRNKNITLILITALLLVSTLVNCGDKKKEEPKADESAQTTGGDDLAKGKEAFELNCSSCHGLAGAGDGAASAALNPKPRNFKAPAGEWKNGKTVEGVTKTLKEGIPGSAMVAWTHLDDATLSAIAKYVVELGK